MLSKNHWVRPFLVFFRFVIEILFVTVAFDHPVFDQFHICAGMYFDHPEIVPDGLLGDFRFNKGDEAVAR